MMTDAIPAFAEPLRANRQGQIICRRPSLFSFIHGGTSWLVERTSQDSSDGFASLRLIGFLGYVPYSTVGASARDAVIDAVQAGVTDPASGLCVNANQMILFYHEGKLEAAQASSVEALVSFVVGAVEASEAQIEKILGLSVVAPHSGAPPREGLMMAGPVHLLPEGFYDLLPESARRRAILESRMMQVFASFGYLRVEPPLLEYEETLLEGPGRALSSSLFGVIDTGTGARMAIRPDITVQVARLAGTRLGDRPRPLRLAYAGPVLRAEGTPLRPDRQFGQIGCELFGAHGAAADAEVIRLTVRALEAAGVSDLSIDLALPDMPALLFQHFGLDQTQQQTITRAFSRRDAAMLKTGRTCGDDDAWGLALRMLESAGEAERALAMFDGVTLPESMQARLADVREIVTRLRDHGVAVGLTVDPVESRGFAYHREICFTFFAAAARSEIGRGGRYSTGNGGETATGVSIYPDTLGRVVAYGFEASRLYAPAGTAPTRLDALRQEGYIVVEGLPSPDIADARAEAARLDCALFLHDSTISPTGEASGEPHPP